MKKINEKLIELCEREYKEKKLVVPMGDVEKEDDVVYLDFENVSGLFIAGATGTGKSVLIDDIIHSLMYKNKVDDIQFALIDPKEIELNEYNGYDYVIGKKSECDIININNMLKQINEIIEQRIETRTKEPHIFVVVDEGYDIYNIDSNREILKNILKTGNKIGVHLIFATNSYLKEYAESGFIDRFKYRVSFDLASLEQAKYINIKDSSWLKGNGDAIVKGVNSIPYRFQTYMVPDDEIGSIAIYSKKHNK